MKKLLNPILKHFGLQLVKRPKQRRTNLKGWKQQGRGTRVTVRVASDLQDMSKIIIANAIANIEPRGPTNQLIKPFKFKKGVKQIDLGFLERPKQKKRKYTKHESTTGPLTKQSKNIIIKAMGLEEKK